MPGNIDVTVAAVIESEERFLVVEERAYGRLVYNQPAGHLEPAESLIDAAVRETLEETGYRFTPKHLLGIYLWHSLGAARSFVRVAFVGDGEAPAETPRLDDGIVAVHWLSRNQLVGAQDRLRSPMVLKCVDDYRAGIRYPLDALSHVDHAIRNRAGVG